MLLALLARPATAASPYLYVPSKEFLEASPSHRYANMTNAEAYAELDRRGVPYRKLDKVRGVRAPVRFTGKLHGVHIHSSLPEAKRATSIFEILDARLALTLDDFCELLERHDIVEVVHYTMYRPNLPKPGSKEEAMAKAAAKKKGTTKGKGAAKGKGASTRKGGRKGKAPAGKQGAAKKSKGTKSKGTKSAATLGKGSKAPKQKSGTKAQPQKKKKGEPKKKGSAPKGKAPSAKAASKKPKGSAKKSSAKGSKGAKGAKGSKRSTRRKGGKKGSKPSRRSKSSKKKQDPAKVRHWAPPGTRHPAGLAIDVGGLRKRDGRWLSVAHHFNGKIGARTCGPTAKQGRTPASRELRSIVCESADLGLFTYVLTPNYDAPHADHFHMEIRGDVHWFLYH